MATVNVHAGDFLKGVSFFVETTGGAGYLALKNATKTNLTVPITLLEAVEQASEESVKKIGGTIGWGIAGAVVLGPVGLLAGLLLGGKKKEVTFVARFKDGRKLLATTDSASFTKLQASVF